MTSRGHLRAPGTSARSLSHATSSAATAARGATPPASSTRISPSSRTWRASPGCSPTPWTAWVSRCWPRTRATSTSTSTFATASRKSTRRPRSATTNARPATSRTARTRTPSTSTAVTRAAHGPAPGGRFGCGYGVGYGNRGQEPGFGQQHGRCDLMTLDGGGGGDIFEGMTHEQMLKWLGRADHGTVQAAADRLTAAAKEIHKIAEDLKTRPQYVSWKGDGADAFRAWSADLAKSAIHMGDFSQNSGKWLAQASHAIAKAKSQMPPLPDDSGSGSGKTVSSTAARRPRAWTLSTRRGRRRRSAWKLRRRCRSSGQSYQQASTQMTAISGRFSRLCRTRLRRVTARPTGHLKISLVRSPAGTVSGTTSDSVARQHGSISDNIGTRHSPAELSVDRPSTEGSSSDRDGSRLR